MGITAQFWTNPSEDVGETANTANTVGTSANTGNTDEVTINSGITVIEPPSTTSDEQQMETDSDNYNLAEVGRQARAQTQQGNLDESETDRELEDYLQRTRQQTETTSENFEQMAERVQEANNNKPAPEPPTLHFDIAHASTDQAMPSDPNARRAVKGKYKKGPIHTNTGSNLSRLDPESGLNSQTNSNPNSDLRRSKRIPAAKRTDRYGAINYY